MWSLTSTVNLKIVEFLYKKWISKVDNNSDFAKNHNIDEKTVRLIKEGKKYRTSLETIENICEAENLNLSQFKNEECARNEYTN